MGSIRQLVEVVLLLAEGIHRAWLEAADFKSLELAVERVAEEATRQFLVMALQARDRELMEGRDRRWKVVGMGSRSLLTKVGEIRFQRRYYRDQETGEQCFLLDEAMGLWPRRRYSPAVREMGLELAVETSFGVGYQFLKRWSQGQAQSSRMAIWQDIQASGMGLTEEGERVRKALFEEGEAPEGSRVTAELDIEFDELFVPGRRRKDGRKGAHWA